MEFEDLGTYVPTDTVEPPEDANGSAKYIGPHELTDDDYHEEPPDLPDASITNPPKRSRIAVQYERKVGEFLGGIAKETLQHPATVADGAATLYYAGSMATAWGDLAAVDKRVRTGVDWVVGGTNNPYSAVVFASVPWILQLVRNHEPEVETTARVFRIPFTKREIPIKIRFRIKGRMRALFTHDPDELVNAALTPPIRAQLEANGVKIAKRKRARRSD